MFPAPGQMRGEAFSKATIRFIVQEVENGALRKDLCRKHGMSSTTLDEWMARYGSALYHQNKKKAFTQAHRNAMARAILEGRLSVQEAAVANGVRKTTINRWVGQKQKEEAELTGIKKEAMPSTSPVSDHALADELSQAVLKIKALETLIDVAEQEFKIAIRKKSGAKQSLK